LDQTPATSDPVTDDTDKNLTENDTDDFEVGERVNPLHVAVSVWGLPAGWEGTLEKWLNVTNGEEHVTDTMLIRVQNESSKIGLDLPLKKKTSTWNDHVAKVEADRAERVDSHHSADRTELLCGFR